MTSAVVPSAGFCMTSAVVPSATTKQPPRRSTRLARAEALEEEDLLSSVEPAAAVSLLGPVLPRPAPSPSRRRSPRLQKAARTEASAAAGAALTDPLTPLHEVLEPTLLSLGDTPQALVVAAKMAQASRECRATVSGWRQSFVSRFHLDFGRRELARFARRERQTFVLQQMRRHWAPNALAVTVRPRFRAVQQRGGGDGRANELLSGLQLRLSDDNTVVRSVNEPAHIASGGMAVNGPLMTPGSGSYALRLRFDALPYHPTGYVSVGLCALSSRLFMGPGHAPDQIAWVFRYGYSRIVACLRQHPERITARGAIVQPPPIAPRDELLITYDSARRTLECANLTRGGVATVHQRGIPRDAPLSFALGGTNGLVASLLELACLPPVAEAEELEQPGSSVDVD